MTAFYLKEPLVLLEEIRAVIREREPGLRKKVGGNLALRNALKATTGEYLQVLWILQAQLGTLDKLVTLFRRDGEYETFEVLAIARNLFENLVWMRLFKRTLEYGLIFYEQLLLQQMQNTSSMISKIEREAALFEECDREDDALLRKAIPDEVLHGDPSDEQVRAAGRHHRELQAQLDERVRRAFTLYSSPATFNGYGYQAHLLRTEVLPKHRTTLDEIQSEIRLLRANHPIINGKDQKARERWNWRQKADEAGMSTQYEFLYGYTSRLLHSTPLNVITEKSMSKDELLVMLDYIYVAVTDICDDIATFSYPGELDVIVI